MREVAGLAALLYVLVYLVAQAWSRRRPARVVVICPLRSAAVPEEILQRFGQPRPVEDLRGVSEGGFTIAYVTDAPGISLASVTDVASLEARLGPYLRRPVFGPERGHCLACLRDQKWSAAILCHLAFEVLHRVRPQSLVVDFRPSPGDLARARRVSTTEPDVDLGIHAYELLCRLRRYSCYRDATFLLIWTDGERTWGFTGSR